MKIQTMRNKLENMGVLVCGYNTDFNNTNEEPLSIWVSLEDGLLAEEDIHDFLEKSGFYLEPYDSGTGFIGRQPS